MEEDMVEELTNERRAGFAHSMVSIYAVSVGQSDESETTNIVDLLTDLMHHCKLMDYDFDELVADAELHFIIETELGDEATATAEPPGESPVQ